MCVVHRFVHAGIYYLVTPFPSSLLSLIHSPYPSSLPFLLSFLFPYDTANLLSFRQLENTSSQKYLFFQRQFWTCVKLVGNITQWAGLISPDILQELVLDGLLNRLVCMQNIMCCVTSVGVRLYVLGEAMLTGHLVQLHVHVQALPPGYYQFFNVVCLRPGGGYVHSRMHSLSTTSLTLQLSY